MFQNNNPHLPQKSFFPASHDLEADLKYFWVSEFVDDSFTLSLVASFMDVEVVRSEYFFPNDFSVSKAQFVVQ